MVILLLLLIIIVIIKNNNINDKDNGIDIYVANYDNSNSDNSN